MNIKKQMITLLSTALFLATTGCAKEPNVWQNKQGEVQQDVAWRKSKDNFGAMLFAINDVPVFEKAWNQPASPDYTPMIPAVESAKVNETITLILMFGGCKANTQGNCKLTGQLNVIEPSGKTIHTQDVTFYDAKQPPEKITSASPVQLGFAINDDEPTGTYTFKYVVTDAHANTTLSLERSVQFSK